jgi:hypothetical protein
MNFLFILKTNGMKTKEIISSAFTSLTAVYAAIKVIEKASIKMYKMEPDAVRQKK